MKQIDIFGGMTLVDNIPTYTGKKKGIVPFKVVFRANYGYKEGFECKKCNFFTSSTMRSGRVHYKCKKLGITCSPATDIRLRDVACNLYGEVKDDK